MWCSNSVACQLHDFVIHAYAAAEYKQGNQSCTQVALTAYWGAASSKSICLQKPCEAGATEPTWPQFRCSINLHVAAGMHVRGCASPLVTMAVHLYYKWFQSSHMCHLTLYSKCNRESRDMHKCTVMLICNQSLRQLSVCPRMTCQEGALGSAAVAAAHLT